MIFNNSRWIVLVLLVLVGAYWLFSLRHTIEENTVKQGTKVKIPILFDGYNLREYKSHIAQVKQNDVISTILEPFQLNPQTIQHMLDISEHELNFKKVVLGNTYALLSEKNTDSIIPRYFIYNINNLEYAVFSFSGKDSVTFQKMERTQKVVQRMVGAKIVGSLYETLDNFGVHDELTSELAEIFRWSVDFYKIQKNDEIKVIFSERYVDDEPIGIDSIHAVYLKHKGNEYYAFYFPATKQYYRENGMEMKNLFLKAPVKFSRISSKFSRARFHPVSKIWKAHLGTDYAAPAGTPIISTADGVVLEARYKVFNGNYVKVKHNSVYATQYLHMSRIAKGIRPGVRVSQGQVIGYVGATGLATGPHVCYRFWKNGVQVNALKQDMMMSKPLDRRYKGPFQELVNQIKPVLDSIPS